MMYVCLVCGGRGKVFMSVCSLCGGMGRFFLNDWMIVDIFFGFFDGDLLWFW